MAGPKTMDLTKGSVTKQILLFALPIMLGNLLQQLYNVADKAIVGQFAENGELGLAAIGATSSATQLIIGLFTGLGGGVNVISANQLGAKKNGVGGFLRCCRGNIGHSGSRRDLAAAGNTYRCI